MDTPTLAAKERELMDLLTRRVHATFRDAREAGVPAEVFDDVEAIAASMAAGLPTAHVYDLLVGPFYDTGGLTRWWGISRQAVNKAVAAGTVIACRLADDGPWVYPTWQFTAEGTVHPHLITLWKILREAADLWTCAVWLRSRQPGLGDRTAVEWVTDGHPVDTALALASADAERWRQ
ncbi:hypothetical protein HCA61_16765 [Rhodococcus sp. HNM0563]|uniref:hypothetical protein n=1 Tax=unclassified Rhodococcus (in: high G+C Gram-positive bacteria) TaxID=192944 RepID=UPI00146B8067|nr:MULTISPECIES: hypothetical protein [unclassified Rhodococcus (in: high G+C Gram-positive bacteria)]MCK0091203.1 hypothetical protein [Rhodococcus sp. F64268]NLU63908.1 hypothetical protein [Rhodococcus sp. HNM0563]